MYHFGTDSLKTTKLSRRELDFEHVAPLMGIPSKGLQNIMKYRASQGFQREGLGSGLKIAMKSIGFIESPNPKPLHFKRDLYHIPCKMQWF